MQNAHGLDLAVARPVLAALCSNRNVGTKMDVDSAVALILKKNIIKRLEGFRAYTNELEVKFENDIEKLAEKYGLKDLEVSNDGTRIMEIIMSEEYRNISDTFIGTFRDSTLVSLYSFLENTMRSICAILHKFNGYPIELSDLTGDGIQRSKIYLEKMAKIDFSQINGVWANLQNLNLLRNCIVHVEGDTLNFKSKEKLRNIISNNQYIYLKRDREIVIEREYIEFAIDEVEKFINYLFLKVFNC